MITEDDGTKGKIKSVAELIKNSKHLVIFTGVGISTASGLSDYRGPDGVWTRRDKGLKPLPMSILCLKKLVFSLLNHRDYLLIFQLT